jgi:hypothetical protein
VKVGLVVGVAEEYNIPEKKEVTPQVTHIHLHQTNVAVNYKVLAVQQNLTAIQVNIGV